MRTQMIKTCIFTETPEATAAYWGAPTSQQDTEGALADVRRETSLCQVHRYSTEPVHSSGEQVGSVHSLQLGTKDGAIKSPDL